MTCRNSRSLPYLPAVQHINQHLNTRMRCVHVCRSHNAFTCRAHSEPETPLIIQMIILNIIFTNNPLQTLSNVYTINVCSPTSRRTSPPPPPFFTNTLHTTLDTITCVLAIVPLWGMCETPFGSAAVHIPIWDHK